MALNSFLLRESYDTSEKLPQCIMDVSREDLMALPNETRLEIDSCHAPRLASRVVHL